MWRLEPGLRQQIPAIETATPASSATARHRALHPNGPPASQQYGKSLGIEARDIERFFKGQQVSLFSKLTYPGQIERNEIIAARIVR